MNRRVGKIVGAVVFSGMIAGAAFAVYAQKKAASGPPMQFSTGLRVFTSLSRVKLYDGQGGLLACEALSFPVTQRPNYADRSAVVFFDRNHLVLQDSLGHTVFQRPLSKAGQVTVDCSFHGYAKVPGLHPFQLGEGQRCSLGEGVKSATPHAYTLVIAPNYATRFL